MRTKDIVTQLFNTIKLLESALACAPDTHSGDAEEDCELVYTTALDLVAWDAKTLFELFHEKLSWVLREAEIGDIFDSAEWKEEDVAALLAMFKHFYADCYPKLAAFLADVEAVTALYRPRKGDGGKKKKGKGGGTATAPVLTLDCPPSFPATFSSEPKQEEVAAVVFEEEREGEGEGEGEKEGEGEEERAHE
jgi:hypothetical protein